MSLNLQDATFRTFAARCQNSGVHSGPTYTVDKLASILPEMMRKAAVERGFDPARYDQKSEYILTTIRACSQITAEMAQDFRILSYRDDGKYAVCTQNGMLRGPLYGGYIDISRLLNKQSEAGDIMLLTTPRLGNSWGDGTGFYVNIKGVLNADSWPDILFDAHITH